MARETDFAWLRFHVSDASRTASEEADSDLKASGHTDEPRVSDEQRRSPQESAGDPIPRIKNGPKEHGPGFSRATR